VEGDVLGHGIRCEFYARRGPRDSSFHRYDISLRIDNVAEDNDDLRQDDDK